MYKLRKDKQSPYQKAQSDHYSKTKNDLLFCTAQEQQRYFKNRDGINFVANENIHRFVDDSIGIIFKKTLYCYNLAPWCFGLRCGGKFSLLPFRNQKVKQYKMRRAIVQQIKSPFTRRHLEANLRYYKIVENNYE